MEPPPFQTLGNSKIGQAFQFLDIMVGAVSIGGEASDRETLVSGAWHPTKVLARHVEAHLKRGNLYDDVGVLLPVTKLYGSDKRDLWYLPYGPVREWYYGNRAAKGALAADSDVVVEVGISNYEFAMGRFLLQVHLRAVDPLNGEILGRARVYEQADFDTEKMSSENEAQQFKALFAGMAQRLTKQALRQLGL